MFLGLLCYVYQCFPLMYVFGLHMYMLKSEEAIGAPETGLEATSWVLET